jgi:hypothetical protein
MAELANQFILIRNMLVKGLDLYLIRNRRPVGYGQGDLLIIIEYSSAEFHKLPPSFASENLLPSGVTMPSMLVEFFC